MAIGKPDYSALETPLPKQGDVNYYCRWTFFHGYIITCNDDGSIPINSLVVLDLSLLHNAGAVNEQCQRIVSMHNELLRKSQDRHY